MLGIDEAIPALALMSTRFPWDRRVWASAIDRLAGLTKAFHCEVIYSEEVKTASGIDDGAMDLGQVRVKGRRHPVRLFGIGDEATVHEQLKSFERDAEGSIVMTVK